MSEPRPQPETAINTRSGRVLDFANPSVEAIALDDIAAGLAMVPRFGAQARRFYSVAQHAVSVSLIVERLGRPDLALAALHHDSHEAYACDIPRPLKGLLEPKYSKITGRLDDTIAAALGFEVPREGSTAAHVIKTADDASFIVEAEQLLAGELPGMDVEQSALAIARAAVEVKNPRSPEAAERNFRRSHERLTDRSIDER